MTSKTSTSPEVFIVDGGLGAGKTTLMERIVQSPHVVEALLGPNVLVVPIYEPLLAWQVGGIFERMCSDPENWATEFQHVAMVTRIATWASTMAHTTPASGQRVVFLLERSPAADKLVFTEVHRRRGAITDKDAAEHADWHERMWEKRPCEVTRVALLKCPLEVELGRMGWRQRDGENKYKAQYLEEIFEQYDGVAQLDEWPHKKCTVSVNSDINYRDCDVHLYTTAAAVFGCGVRPEAVAKLNCVCQECSRQ